MRYLLLLALASALLGSLGCRQMDIGAEDETRAKMPVEDRRELEANECAFWGSDRPAALLQTQPIQPVSATQVQK